MPDVELDVRSIIPDSTAATTRQALGRLGIASILDVHRVQRWRMSFEGGDAYELAARLERVDVLVNANKHRATTRILDGMPGEHRPPRSSRPRSAARSVWVAVESRGDSRASTTLSVLRDRLGFERLTGCTLTEMWRLDVASDSLSDAQGIGRRAMEALLVNPQFQKGYLLDD